MQAAATAGITDRDIREQRQLVQQYRHLADLAEKELARLLAEAGRRPGDGSDQPSIFPTGEEPGPGLF